MHESSRPGRSGGSAAVLIEARLAMIFHLRKARRMAIVTRKFGFGFFRIEKGLYRQIEDSEIAKSVLLRFGSSRELIALRADFSPDPSLALRS